MAYLGTTPAVGYSKIEKQTITGDGNTTYTLINPVGNEQEIEVYVNNVRQEPGNAYTTFGTTLTMTGTVTSNDSFYVIYQGKAERTLSIIPEKLSDGTYLFGSNVSITGNLTVGTGTTSITNDGVIATDMTVTGNIIFDSPKSTRIWEPDSNTLSVVTSSTERIRVDSGGRVGIGTAPSEQLHMTGNLRIGDAVAVTPTGSAPLAFARAWVNFNGTGTVAIRASYNVTSITDNNTGNYTVNFTTAMPDANYAAVGSGFRAAFSAAEACESFTNFAVGSVQALFATGSSGVAFDTNAYSVAIFR